MNRATLLCLVMCSLVVIGLATRDGRILALAIPFMVSIAAALVYRPEQPQIKVSRVLSEHQAAPNAPIVVTLSISNEGEPIEELLIDDQIPPSLTLTEGMPRLFTTIRRGETIELQYTVSGKRGSFEFEPVLLTVSDHFDLFRRKMQIPAPARLLVLPEMSRLRRVAIRPMRTRLYSGLNPSRQSGSGTDFFGVRTYQPGDPLRWMNWRLSARHPRAMFTNEFESERIADVGLILDARTRNDLQTADDSLFNHGIRAAASLADVFLKDGNRVGLLIYGRSLHRIFPGYGKIQRERILRALAQAQTGDHQVFKTLAHLPTRFFPAKSQLVLISPLCEDDFAVLRRLRAVGYRVLVISPDPVAFEFARLTSQPHVELAARIARVERTLLLRKLRRFGILVVDWQVDTPLEQTFLSLMRRLPHWFRAMETAV